MAGNMWKFGVLIAGAGSVLATCAHAEDASQPLFSAFRSFCADTHAVPSAVQLAVEAAGGKLRSVSRDALGHPMSSMNWDVTVGDHAFFVSTAAARAPLGPDKVQFSTECSITSLNDEVASMSSLRRWAVVRPASDSDTSLKKTVFLFRDDGPDRVAVTGAAANNLDHWMMTLLKSGSVSSVQLMHFELPEPVPGK